MMAELMLGKEVVASLNRSLQERAAGLREKGIAPTLAIVRAGENPGDLSYERGAVKRCEQIGVAVRSIVKSASVTTQEMTDLMEQLGRDSTVHGVLVLRPLPPGTDQAAVERALPPEKDVDCMTDASLSAVFTGKQIGYGPCTAEACLEILDYYGINVSGLRAVVVGRSLVIGKPLSMMLLKRNATVTICHTRTKDLPSVTREADLLVAAAGCAGMIRKEHVRAGQIILDVGINTDENGRLCGDVLFDEVQDQAAYLTPVPGGVGSVTTSVLLRHVIEAAEKTLL